MINPREAFISWKHIEQDPRTPYEQAADNLVANLSTKDRKTMETAIGGVRHVVLVVSSMNPELAASADEITRATFDESLRRFSEQPLTHRYSVNEMIERRRKVSIWNEVLDMVYPKERTVFDGNTSGGPTPVLAH